LPQAELRIGDCVAVERGNFNNLRLVDDTFDRAGRRVRLPCPALL
jgi:hypothetical protein